MTHYVNSQDKLVHFYFYFLRAEDLKFQMLRKLTNKRRH